MIKRKNSSNTWDVVSGTGIAPVQYTTMPTPWGTYGGHVVQYIGSDTADYKFGHFYVCQYDINTHIWAWNDVNPVSRVADMDWTQLTLSYATAGSVWFSCKNGIVFIEGGGLNWPSAGTAWQIKSLATGIPADYKPAAEVKGSVFISYGQVPYSMSWAHNASQDVVFWCKDACEGAGGRLYLSYPIF